MHHLFVRLSPPIYQVGIISPGGLWAQRGAWRRRAQCHRQQSSIAKRWTSPAVLSVLLRSVGCLHARGVQDGEGEDWKPLRREWLGILRYALLLRNKLPQISWLLTIPCSYPPFLWVRIWAQLSCLLGLGPFQATIRSGDCVYIWSLGWAGIDFCVHWGCGPNSL